MVSKEEYFGGITGFLGLTSMVLGGTSCYLGAKLEKNFREKTRLPEGIEFQITLANNEIKSLDNIFYRCRQDYNYYTLNKDSCKRKIDDLNIAGEKLEHLKNSIEKDVYNSNLELFGNGAEYGIKSVLLGFVFSFVGISLFFDSIYVREKREMEIIKKKRFKCSVNKDIYCTAVSKKYRNLTEMGN